MFSPTRTLYCLLIFLYLVVTLECKGERYDLPPQCAEVECPSYSVIHSEKEFEIRSYKYGLWMSSPKISETSYLAGFGKGFFLLDDYYRGKNVEHVKINQTLPIMVDFEAAPNYYIHNITYTVYFYVPKKYENNIPTPLSHEINTVKLPKHNYVAVRRFIGEDRDELIPEQIHTLKKSLEGTPYQRAATVNMFTILFYKLFNEDNNDVDVREILLSFD